MKKGLLLTSLILGAIPPLTAGGVFYNSNQSAEYFRTFDRNSAIDNADIVYSNMAGTVKLREGWTWNLSNQTVFQWATVRTINNPVVGDRKYESSNPAPVVPNFYAAYRKNNWAIFTGIETIGATATREWKDGLPTLDLMGKQLAGYGSAASGVIAGDAYVAAIMAGKTPAQAQAAAVAAGLDASSFTASSYLKGSSYYIALRVGGAYQINPFISVALAGRLVTAKQDIVGKVDAACTYNQFGHDLRTQKRVLIHTSDEAKGFSGEFGVNLFPVNGMVVNLTYEMATPLEFKTTVHDKKDGNGLFVDGKRSNLDLPTAFRLGVGYQFTPALRASMSVNHFLEGSVNWNMLDNALNQNDHKKDYGNTTEYSMSAEYRISKKLLVSMGLDTNRMGQKKSSTLDISVPGAHAHYMSIGGGFQYELSDRMKFNFGIGHTRFINTFENADVVGDQAIQANFAANGVSVNPRKEYNKQYIVVAFGIDYHF